MEGAGVVQVFEKSVEENVRYTEYLANEDFKVFRSVIEKNTYELDVDIL